MTAKHLIIPSFPKNDDQPCNTHITHTMCVYTLQAILDMASVALRSVLADLKGSLSGLLPIEAAVSPRRHQSHA